ncbi:MAG: bifunctional metallophosphatase/5'-nucleotidase, partial [Erysipelotrichaceae bacterium]|nr:bifunctional metallophosphatase/5'-nucleotidase [Erysipelotrichaceae bacterium]
DVPTGEYRVKDIEIFNRETGEYEPLDLEKTYTIGGVNYILRNGGGGLTMMMDNEAVVDFVNEDYMVLAEYAKSFAVGEDGKPHINNANSPLAKYSNYLYDYEDPWGSDRLIIK